jgi:hypothetical protein
MLKSLVNLGVATLILAAAAPAAAQIETVDPNQPGAWQNEPAQSPETQSPEAPPPAAADDYAPVEGQPPQAQSNEIYTPPPAAPTPVGAAVPREDVFSAAENLFGRGARGLAGILEGILRDQGEPIAYIAGQEAGGAFMVGIRYGSGVMHHQIEGDRDVYWTGPSIGFDVGGDINKVFVLVYNLHDSERLFRRFPGGEGHAYFVGGFSAQYLRDGDVVLIPVRLGGGLRLGVNVGYMKFSERNRWMPF